MNNEVAMQKQIDSLTNELRFMSDHYENSLRDLRSELDGLKLELAALRTFLESAFPHFAERFPELLAKTIREVDPEFE